MMVGLCKTTQIPIHKTTFIKVVSRFAFLKLMYGNIKAHDFYF